MMLELKRGVTVEYSPAEGPHRRVWLELLSEGGFKRVTKRYTVCK